MISSKEQIYNYKYRNIWSTKTEDQEKPASRRQAWIVWSRWVRKRSTTPLKRRQTSKKSIECVKITHSYLSYTLGQRTGGTERHKSGRKRVVQRCQWQAADNFKSADFQSTLKKIHSATQTQPNLTKLGSKIATHMYSIKKQTEQRKKFLLIFAQLATKNIEPWTRPLPTLSKSLLSSSSHHHLTLTFSLQKWTELRSDASRCVTFCVRWSN